MTTDAYKDVWVSHENLAADTITLIEWLEKFVFAEKMYARALAATDDEEATRVLNMVYREVFTAANSAIAPTLARFLASQADDVACGLLTMLLDVSACSPSIMYRDDLLRAATSHANVDSACAIVTRIPRMATDSLIATAIDFKNDKLWGVIVTRFLDVVHEEAQVAMLRDHCTKTLLHLIHISKFSFRAIIEATPYDESSYDMWTELLPAMAKSNTASLYRRHLHFVAKNCLIHCQHKLLTLFESYIPLTMELKIINPKLRKCFKERGVEPDRMEFETYVAAIVHSDCAECLAILEPRFGTRDATRPLNFTPYQYACMCGHTQQAAYLCRNIEEELTERIDADRKRVRID